MFLAPIMCNQRRAESALNCESIVRLSSLCGPILKKVALPKGMETKMRHGALPRPLHSREVENM